MPTGALVNAAGIMLQYFLLITIYIFLDKVLQAIYQDLKLKTENVSIKTMPMADIKGNTSVQLLVIDKAHFPLAESYAVKDSIAIGRGENNDIVINDSFVSNEHACIARYKDGYCLTDLNSTNGTCLNGKKLTEETRLQPGDIIMIGKVSLKFTR